MRIRRLSERARDDRADLDAILDAGWVGTLATVVAGQPQVVPVLYARRDDAILLHGSTGAGTLRAAATGAPVAFCVTHLDAFVYAASLFESSANYRSAVVQGTCETLQEADAEAALRHLSQHLMPGRAAEVRSNRPKELAATLVLQLPIRAGQWAAKVRSGPPSHEPDDDPTVWTGLLPVRAVFGEPIGSTAAVADSIPVADSVRRRHGSL